MVRTKKTEPAEKKSKKKAVRIPSAALKKAKIPAKKKSPVVQSAVGRAAEWSVKKKPAMASVPKRKSASPKPAVRKPLAAKPAIVLKRASDPKAAGVQSAPKKVRGSRVLKVKKNATVLDVPIVGLPEVQPARDSFFQEVLGVLPAGYGDHFISLMICSPYQLYAYWEIQPHREAEALQLLGGGWDQVKSVLRVYNLTQNAKGSFFFDIELGGGADRWFLSVEPNHSYRVEIGLRHADGRFIMLARSNDVTTPRVTMSEILDEEWMGIDFERMYTLSGGFGPGQHGSVTLQKLMDERLRFGDTSGSGAGMLSSGSMVKKKDRHFWFTLNCELTVHGATAPDAQVTMNGQAVQLRPDGTFTLRYSLPDGNIRLEAKAVSADLIEERTITPVIQRNTERPEPVIRRNRGRG